MANSSETLQPAGDEGDGELKARLIALIAREVGVSPARLNLEMALADDLGVAGQDGADLLDAIGREFGVDLSVVDWAEYFGEEAPFDPLLAVWRGFERLFRRGLRESDSPPLRIRHLLRTVQRGEWSAPQD